MFCIVAPRSGEDLINNAQVTPVIHVETLDRIVREHNLPLTAWGDGLPRYRYRKAEFSGNCQKPVKLELHSRPSAARGKRMIVVPQEGLPMTIDMSLRCRSCDNCLRARAAHWRLRALAETRASFAVGARTWFVTLTIRPEERQSVLDTLRWQYARQGDDFDALTSDEVFRAKHRLISKEITKYIKRLRKNSGAELRFICVAEVHKDGEPHYHLLVHEMRQEQPLRKRILEQAWQIGFSKNILVNDLRQVTYVCKYLTKSNLARVRASVAYGETLQNALEHNVV